MVKKVTTKCPKHLQRALTAAERNMFVALVRARVPQDQICRMTGISEMTYRFAQQRDAGLAAQVEAATLRVVKIDGKFDIDKALNRLVPHLIAVLEDEMMNGRGTARINAVLALKKWIEDRDRATDEKYDITEAHPENEKIISISEAV